MWRAQAFLPATTIEIGGTVEEQASAKGQALGQTPRCVPVMGFLRSSRILIAATAELRPAVAGDQRRRSAPGLIGIVAAHAADRHADGLHRHNSGGGMCG